MITKDVIELYNKIIDVLADAPDEDECTDEANEIYADMFNLKDSMEKAMRHDPAVYDQVKRLILDGNGFILHDNKPYILGGTISDSLNETFITVLETNPPSYQTYTSLTIDLNEFNQIGKLIRQISTKEDQ